MKNTKRKLVSRVAGGILCGVIGLTSFGGLSVGAKDVSNKQVPNSVTVSGRKELANQCKELANQCREIRLKRYFTSADASQLKTLIEEARQETRPEKIKEGLKKIEEMRKKIEEMRKKTEEMRKKTEEMRKEIEKSRPTFTQRGCQHGILMEKLSLKVIEKVIEKVEEVINKVEEITEQFEEIINKVEEALKHTT